MAELEDIRTGRHCVFAMHVHLVFVTKFRHKVFGDPHLSRMEQIMRDVCADFETDLVEFMSGSYFAGSVGGAPLSVVKQYIEQQNRPA